MAISQYDESADPYDIAGDSYDGGPTGVPIGDPRYTITMAAPVRTITVDAPV